MTSSAETGLTAAAHLTRFQLVHKQGRVVRLPGAEQRERDVAQRLGVQCGQLVFGQRGQLGRVRRRVGTARDARLFQQRAGDGRAGLFAGSGLFVRLQRAQVVAVEGYAERIHGRHLAVGGERVLFIVIQIMLHLRERVGVGSGAAGDVAAFLGLFGAGVQGGEQQRRRKQQRQQAFERHMRTVLSVCRGIEYIYCKEGAAKCQERKC